MEVKEGDPVEWDTGFAWAVSQITRILDGRVWVKITRKGKPEEHQAPVRSLRPPPPQAAPLVVPQLKANTEVDAFSDGSWIRGRVLSTDGQAALVQTSNSQSWVPSTLLRMGTEWVGGSWVYRKPTHPHSLPHQAHQSPKQQPRAQPLPPLQSPGLARQGSNPPPPSSSSSHMDQLRSLSQPSTPGAVGAGAGAGVVGQSQPSLAFGANNPGGAGAPPQVMSPSSMSPGGDSLKGRPVGWFQGCGLGYAEFRKLQQSNGDVLSSRVPEEVARAIVASRGARGGGVGRGRGRGRAAPRARVKKEWEDSDSVDLSEESEEGSWSSSQALESESIPPETDSDSDQNLADPDSPPPARTAFNPTTPATARGPGALRARQAAAASASKPVKWEVGGDDSDSHTASGMDEGEGEGEGESTGKRKREDDDDDYEAGEERRDAKRPRRERRRRPLRKGMLIKGRLVEASDRKVTVKFTVGGRTFLAEGEEVSESPERSQPVQPRQRPPRVIVIGAGFAGLSAARELLERGAEVLVVEARHRLGGRCFTKEIADGCLVDIGAGWIHGTNGNPMTSLAAANSLHLQRIPEDCELFNEDGSRVDRNTDQAMEGLFNKMLEKAKLGADRITGRSELSIGGTPVSDDVSLGQMLDELIGKEASPFPSPTHRHVYEWHCANIEYSTGSDVSALSARFWAMDDQTAFDGHHCAIREGYSALINDLAKGVEVRFGHVVTDVRYAEDVPAKKEEDGEGEDEDEDDDEPNKKQPRWKNPGKGVRVSVRAVGEDGKDKAAPDAKPVELRADAVVVTVPLGVLKRNEVQFHPPLPKSKQHSIGALGYGLLDKIVLVFPHRFWDALQLRGGYIGNVSSVRGRYYMFVDHSEVVGKPTLVGLVAGDRAREMEARGKDEVARECVQVLRNIMEKGRQQPKEGGGEGQGQGEGEGVAQGAAGVMPEPVAWWVTEWGSDPYARGSYSYFAVGSSAEDMEEMSHPLNGQVFFAGEATNPEHPSTVHGAYMSGIREARNIIREWYGSLPGMQFDEFVINDPNVPVPDVAECALCGVASPTTPLVVPAASVASAPGRGAAPGAVLGSAGGDRAHLQQQQPPQQDPLPLEKQKQGALLGPIRMNKKTVCYVHEHCACNSPEVGNDDGRWYNVVKAVRRGRQLKCAECKQSGATIGCFNATCFTTRHFLCCVNTGWDFDDPRMGKVFYCSLHRDGGEGDGATPQPAGGAKPAAPAAKSKGKDQAQKSNGPQPAAGGEEDEGGESVPGLGEANTILDQLMRQYGIAGGAGGGGAPPSAAGGAGQSDANAPQLQPLDEQPDEAMQDHQ